MNLYMGSKINKYISVMSNKVEGDTFKPWVAWAVAIVVCIIVWLGGAAITRWYAVQFASGADKETMALWR